MRVCKIMSLYHCSVGLCVIGLAVMSLGSDLIGQSCVIVSFGPESILTLEEFQHKIRQLKNAQPGLGEIMNNLPKEELMSAYERLVNGHVDQEISKKYVRANRLDATRSFKEAQRKAHEELDGRLYLEVYQDALIKEFEATVAKMTDDELRTYYEKNRGSSPMFKRQPFLIKNSQTSAKTESPEFAPLEQVRDEVRQVIKQAELTAFYDKHLEALKQTYHVKINKSCLSRTVDHKDK